MRADQHKARTTRVGPPHLAHFIRAANPGPPIHIPWPVARGLACFFFLIFLLNFYDKTFNV